MPFGIHPSGQGEKPTLRLRQASHEKALFRVRLVFNGTSAMPDLLGSTTMKSTRVAHQYDR
jgi:hypothetical protein